MGRDFSEELKRRELPEDVIQRVQDLEDYCDLLNYRYKEAERERVHALWALLVVGLALGGILTFIFHIHR